MSAIIKISNINDLQDARYCAAVGFEWVCFNAKKDGLSPGTIREMAAWLTGPRFVVECDADNKAALEELQTTFPYHYLCIEASALSDFTPLPHQPLILQVAMPQTPTQVEAEIAAAVQHHPNSKVEIALSPTDAHLFQAYASALIFHFSSLDEVKDWIQNADFQPFGFALHSEVLDGEGFLNYEQLDALVALRG